MSFDASDRPSKRRRTEDSSADEDGRYFAERSDHEFEDRVELEQEQWQNQDRFRHRMEDIFEKYSAIQVDDGDEINIRTGAIEVDRGHLKALPNVDYDDDCDSFTSEEDGIMDDYDEDILDFLQDPVYRAPDWSAEPPAKTRSVTPSSWTPHDELRPLSNLAKHDLPSDETILRQFGSAGPAVLEVLKRQTTDNASSTLPTPEDTQTSSAESHEDDDLSILPHSPVITTPFRFVRPTHADAKVSSVATPQSALPQPRPLECHQDKRSLGPNERLGLIRARDSLRRPRYISPTAKRLTSQQQGKGQSHHRSRWEIHQRPFGRDIGESTARSSTCITKSEPRRVRSARFICPHCQKQFCSKQYLGIHEAKVCSGSTVRFTCPSGCIKSYQYASGLRHHLENLCPYKLPEGFDLDLHLNSGISMKASKYDPVRTKLIGSPPSTHATGRAPRRSFANSADFRELMPSDQSASITQEMHSGAEARRSRLSLRPLNRQPDYRIRKTLKEFLQSAAFSVQPPITKTRRRKTDEPHSHIVVLKVDYSRINFASESLASISAERQMISAWQKQVDSESEEEFGAVSGWQKNAREDTPSDAGYYDSSSRAATHRVVERSRSCVAQWPPENDHSLSDPRSQMPTPPPDRDDLVLRPRRERFLSEKGQSTNFQELVRMQDEFERLGTSNSTKEVLDSEADHSSLLIESSQHSTTNLYQV